MNNLFVTIVWEATGKSMDLINQKIDDVLQEFSSSDNVEVFINSAKNLEDFL